MKKALAFAVLALGLFFVWEDINRGRGIPSELVGGLAGALIMTVIVIVGRPYLQQRGKQRTKKFKQVAEEMGMKFSATAYSSHWTTGQKGDRALLESLSAFDLFSKKEVFLITNVLHGDSEQLGYGEEFEVRILECVYKEGRQHRRVSSQTMICFHSPQLSLPQFSLRPEGLHQKIGSALGYQDIDFESHQTGAEFSKKYLLRGKDEQWMTEEKIRVLFTDKILTFFAAHPDKVFVGGSGDQLIFYREGNLIEPEDTPAFIEEGLEVFRLFASSQPS